MMKLLSCLIVGLSLLFPATITAQNLTDEQAAQVLARVGDEEITVGQFARDLQFRLGRIKSATGKEIKPDLRMRRALMNELIQERILSIAARNAGVVVSDEEVEKQFQERKAVFDSDKAYQGYLQALKLTETKLKEHMRSRIRVKKFIDEKTGVLSASDAEIEERYSLLKSQGKMTRTNDTRDIGVILLRAKGGTDESWHAAEERARAAKKRLDDGEAFDVVAREVSEDPNTAPNGGLLPEMKVGSFFPELEKAMDGLQVGNVSEPVRSTMGWYLLSVREENKPGTIPLEKVADHLRKQVVDTKRKAVVSEIVADAQKLIRVEMMELPPVPGAPGGVQEQ